MRAVISALAVWSIWTLATWLLEGRPRSLLRPEAAGLRLAYAVIANVGIGLVVAGWVVRRLTTARCLTAEAAGFGSLRRALIAVGAGAALGAAGHALQGPPTMDLIVVTNAFSQVLVVSAAEVLVCWSLAGTAVAVGARPRGVLASRLAGAVVASALFALYHAAHSPPFNEPRMIGLLGLVGLATSAFFFVSRDVLGTIVFHNWLGTLGVVQALAAAGMLADDRGPEPRLLLMGAVALAVVAGLYVFVNAASARAVQKSIPSSR